MNFAPSMAAVLLVAVIALAVLGWLAANAPVGYQDETGFHLGTPPNVGSSADTSGKWPPGPVVQHYAGAGHVSIDGKPVPHLPPAWPPQPPTTIFELPPAEPANSNDPVLTPDQERVLICISPDMGWTAEKLAADTGLPKTRVSRIRRGLVKLGLADYVALYQDCGDSDQLAGRGYVLTLAGDKLADKLRQPVGERVA